MTNLEVQLYVALKALTPASNCNKHVNGICQTRKCMLEGGWKPGISADYDMSTCEEHRAVVAMRAFEKQMESAT